MKKIFLIVLVFIIASCSGDDTDTNNLPVEVTYTYEVKKILGGKVQVYSQAGCANMSTFEQKSHVIDTLEIDLNRNPNLQLAVCIELAQYENITTPASNSIMSHVNYINFINLTSIWEDNVYQSIFLERTISGQPIKFTYSESNLNLSNYPELFISNINNNTYETLDIVPEIGHDYEVINSTNDYDVGQHIFYGGIEYIVIREISWWLF